MTEAERERAEIVALIDRMTADKLQTTRRRGVEDARFMLGSLCGLQQCRDLIQSLAHKEPTDG